jgi:hypothetical protein
MAMMSLGDTMLWKTIEQVALDLIMVMLNIAVFGEKVFAIKLE